MATNREIRRLQNIKEIAIPSGDTKSTASHAPSALSMNEGETVFAQEANGQLKLYKKHKGLVWKTNLSKDGNQFVDKDLTIKGKTVLNNVGLGTSVVPDGGIGYAKFAVSGPKQNPDGPHVQYTHTSDSYPIFQQLNWNHDNISLTFDCYYDGDWRSSDHGSNFQIYKINDLLRIRYDSLISQGNVISWNTGLSINTSGKVGIGTVSQSNNADLTLEGGAIALKETVTPSADTDYGKIYTKNDNKLYFQDGAGSEHEVSLEAS